MNKNFDVVFSIAKDKTISDEFLENMEDNIFSGLYIKTSLKGIINNINSDEYSNNLADILLTHYFWNNKNPLSDNGKYRLALINNKVSIKKLNDQYNAQSDEEIKADLIRGKILNRKYFGRFNFTGYEIHEGFLKHGGKLAGSIFIEGS